MTLLATLDDLSDRMTTEFDLSRAQALLADASAMVTLYCDGRTFTTTTATERCRVRNGIARPKGRPIVSIDSVRDVDANDISYVHHFGDRIEVATQVDAWAFVPYATGLDVVDVTYTYGTDEVPDVVRAVVCQIVARSLGTSPEDSGIQSETLGPYTVSLGGAAAAGAVGMLQAERDALAKFGRHGGEAYLNF